MDNAVLDRLLLDEPAMLIDDCDCDVLSSIQQSSVPSSLQWHIHSIPVGTNDVDGVGGNTADSDERSAEKSKSCRSLNVVIAGEHEEAERTLRSETRKRQKPAQRMNRSQREKVRLALLRLEASQLQLALDALEKTMSCKMRLIPAPRPSLAAASVWKPLAKRQQKERTRAETENAELKKMLASQTRLIKALERKMHQQLVRRGSLFVGLL